MVGFTQRVTYVHLHTTHMIQLYNTTDELVAKVLQVIERLMDESSELLKVWSNPELISAVYDASSIARYVC